MNATEFRQIMDNRIATLRGDGKLDEAAKLELAREYFANPKFRTDLTKFMLETQLT